MTGPDGTTPPGAESGPGGAGVDPSRSTPADVPVGPDPHGGWQALASPSPTTGHPATPPNSGSGADTAGLSRLLSRQWVIPVAALAVGILAIGFSVATSGGGPSIFGGSTDAEVCSAYSAAENSWDSWDTDATEIMRLASVASKHSDEDIREAGEKLDNLPMVFSYDRYSTIVQPIRQMCW